MEFGRIQNFIGGEWQDSQSSQIWGTNPRLEVAKHLVELGMIAMAANPSNAIFMAPPLIVTKGEIDEGVAIMDQALEIADSYVEK